jgi:hypothetical protein
MLNSKVDSPALIIHSVNKLTSWTVVLQLEKKFPVYLGTEEFITVFVGVHHRSPF